MWRRSPESRARERFEAYLLRLREEDVDPRRLHYPGLSTDAFYDPGDFPMVNALERSAEAIAREFRALDPTSFFPESENIARTGNWDVLMLMERGKRNDDVCARCPVTMQALETGIRTLAGSAYFSRLAPGTAIEPHAGPTNIRLRCHLAIDAARGCGLRVGGIEAAWTPGRCLVFNDALVHEAWNRGDRDRIVLVADLWHPGLSELEVRLLEGMQRYAAAQARNLAEYWKQNESARGR